MAVQLRETSLAAQVTELKQEALHMETVVSTRQSVSPVVVSTGQSVVVSNGQSVVVSTGRSVVVSTRRSIVVSTGQSVVVCTGQSVVVSR